MATQPGTGGARRAIVKSVLSGDSLLIQDLGPVDGPNTQNPVDRQITLASISAPRLARPKFADQDATPDQPFAWDSREFLRKKCIGKKVLYRIEYSNPSNNRDYCTVKLPEASESLNSMMVAEGWATPLENKSKNERPEQVEMAKKGEEAATAGKGVHNKNQEGAIRDIPTTDVLQLINKLKGKTLDGVVEQVRSGTSFRVTLLPTFHNVVVLLSGAQAPSFRRNKEGVEEPEEYAREAKTFVEQNALHRDVKVTIEGIDKNNNFLGSVECNGRDIAEELIKNGFAKYIASSAVIRGSAGAAKLKAAEKVAKEGRRRIYANYVERTDEPSGTSKEFTARVLGIVHAGLISVQQEGGAEQSINIAGIRAPRGAVSDADVERLAKELNVASGQAREHANAERAYAGEAKEFLRKRLVGNKVKVVFDYVRKATQKEGNDLPEKTFYSVYINDANVGVLLAEQGFVKAQNFPANAPERPADYELILLAENKAKQGGRGWHGNPAKAPARRVNDLSIESNDPKTRQNQITKAKAFLPHVQHNGPHKAVVDYVFSGGRYKITIPAQSCTLAISLSGIKVPKRGEGPESDALSNEALQWARGKINQRDVTIDIETIDKGGNFVGDLYTSKDNSFAVQLVNEGFASVHAATAERMRGGGSALFEAEARAKKAKKNMWKNYDADEEARRAAAMEASGAEAGPSVGVAGQEFLEVIVTEVLKGDRFFFQIVGSESDSLGELVSSLTDLSIQEGNIPEISPKVGDVVRAQFTEDDSWYRAKVTRVIDENNYNVMYFDYGNSEIIPASRIRVLPVGFSTLPVQAHEAGLAFIKAPSLDSEWGRESQLTLRDLTAGKRLMASVQYREGGVVTFMCLADREPNLLINAALIDAGVARVTPPRKLPRGLSSNPTYLGLKEKEAKAKSDRVAMWAYGDAPDSDDDEDEPRGPKAWGKPAAKPATGAKEAAAPPAKKK